MSGAPRRAGLRAGARFLRRFARDQVGVSAIEFAFIAPILIIFYFGMAETCQLLMAKRRVSHSAAAVADLISQTDGDVDIDRLDDRILAANTILSPFPTAGFKLELMSVARGTGSNPQTTVVWSYPAGGPAAGSVYAPKTPLNNGESVIVAKSTYDFESSIGYFLPGVKTMTHTAELRPRKADLIDCADCP